MNDLTRLKALRAIAELLRDRDLALLRRAQEEKKRTEGLLRALDHSTSPTGLSETTAGQVIEHFGLWTAQRRVVLNQRHARDTAAWLNARDDAERAFGRAIVLAKLTRK